MSTHIDTTNTTKVAEALAAVAQLASTLPQQEVITIDIKAYYAAEIFAGREISGDVKLPSAEDFKRAVPGNDGEAAAAEVATQPAADKPKTIRRNADEIAADLTIEQARERRELGLSVDEYLAQQDDPTTPAAAPAAAPAQTTAAPAAEPAPTTAAPVELNTQPATAAETLAQQPAMSTPPTGDAPAATVEDIRNVVGILITEGKEDAIRLYTEKLGVPKLSAADPSQYGAIVAYLTSLTGPSSDDLV